MRMKSFLHVAILAIVLGGSFQSNALSAQTSASGNAQPFQFKFARLGMSLEEFKQATARGDVTVSVPGRFAIHYKKIPSPVCTDNLVGFVVDGFANLQEGVVMCDPSVTGDRINADDEYLKIGNVSADQSHYFFYHGKLYSIEVLANHYTFGTILDVFETKYGPDNRRTIDVFQNGLGGRWRGTNYFWERGTQSISVCEGNGSESSAAIIRDSSLAPPEAPKKPINI